MAYDKDATFHDFAATEMAVAPKTTSRDSMSSLFQNMVIKHAPGGDETRYSSQHDVDTLADYTIRGSSFADLCGLSTAQADLRTMVTAMIDDRFVDGGWMAYVPSRLGHSRILDTAAVALCEAHRYCRDGRIDESILHRAAHIYSRALQLVQTSLSCPRRRSSDETILAIALLSHVETLMRDDNKGYVTHWSGIQSLILSRPRSQPPSDVLRAIFYALRSQSFGIPCSKGVPSPFEKARWFALEPACMGGLPHCASRLRHLSQQLLLRLPRLIASVRNLMDKGVPPTAGLLAALELANVFATCQDRKAEDTLLHSIKLVRTRNEVKPGEGQEPSNAHASYSFSFSSYDELMAAVSYWQSRLVFINLCCRFTSSVGDLDRPFSDLRADALQAEQLRLAINLIMSWQYAKSLGEFTVGKMRLSMVALWGALVDKESFRGMPVRIVRGWTLQRYGETLGRESNSSAALQLEMISCSLAGGPLFELGEVLGLA